MENKQKEMVGITHKLSLDICRLTKLMSSPFRLSCGSLLYVIAPNIQRKVLPKLGRGRLLWRNAEEGSFVEGGRSFSLAAFTDRKMQGPGKESQMLDKSRFGFCKTAKKVERGGERTKEHTAHPAPGEPGRPLRLEWDTYRKKFNRTQRGQ